MKRAALVLGVLLVTACGDDTLRMPFQDELGRQCVLELEPSSPFTITCDVEPTRMRECPEDEEPGYWATGSADQPLELCVLCFDETGRVGLAGREGCGLVVCEVPIDCAFGEQICVDGLCWGDPTFEP